VINTHHHFDHAGGLRDAVAEGTTILTQRDNQTYYERILSTGTRLIRPAGEDGRVQEAVSSGGRR
jgi:glyoxylase-like metal-dependent hydrolase (beta-lactamase superfamily II)